MGGDPSAEVRLAFAGECIDFGFGRAKGGLREEAGGLGRCEGRVGQRQRSCGGSKRQRGVVLDEAALQFTGRIVCRFDAQENPAVPDRLNNPAGSECAFSGEFPALSGHLAVCETEHFGADFAGDAETEVGDGLGRTETRKIEVHDREGAVAAQLDGGGAKRRRVRGGGGRAKRRDVVRARIVENRDRSHARGCPNCIAGTRSQRERGNAADRITRAIAARSEAHAGRAGTGRKRDRARQRGIVHPGCRRAIDLIIDGERSGGGAGARKRIDTGCRALGIGRGVGGDHADDREIVGRDVVDFDQSSTRRGANAAHLNRVTSRREVGDQRGVFGTALEGKGTGLAEGGIEGSDVCAGAPIVVGGDADVGAGVVDDLDFRVGERAGHAEAGQGGPRCAHQDLAATGAWRDDETRDDDARARADERARGKIHQASGAGNVVNLHQPDTGRGADSADGRGVGTGSKIGRENRRIPAVGREIKRAHGSERRRTTDGGRGPIVVGENHATGGIGDVDLRVADRAGDVEGRRPERWADGSNQNILVRTLPDDETDHGDISAGTDLSARGQVGETLGLNLSDSQRSAEQGEQNGGKGDFHQGKRKEEGTEAATPPESDFCVRACARWEQSRVIECKTAVNAKHR